MRLYAMGDALNTITNKTQTQHCVLEYLLRRVQQCRTVIEALSGFTCIFTHDMQMPISKYGGGFS